MATRYHMSLFLCLQSFTIEAQGPTVDGVLGFAMTKRLTNDVSPSGRGLNSGFLSGHNFLLGIRLAWGVSEYFSVSGGIHYVDGRHEFELPCGCATPHDRLAVIENTLRLQEGTIDAGLRLSNRHERAWYAEWSIGLTGFLAGARSSSYDIRFYGQRPDSSFTLEPYSEYVPNTVKGRTVASVLRFAIGKSIGMWQPITVMVFIQQDLSAWTYSVKNHQGSDVAAAFRRPSIGLAVGLRLLNTQNRDELKVGEDKLSP